MTNDRLRRRLPVGAEILPSGDCHFRVWCQNRGSVSVVFEDGPLAGKDLPLDREDQYFSATIERAQAGSLYRYRLDGGELFPDPASRFQPTGPHGPSQIVDPNTFAWTDQDWKGSALEGQIIYEMHIGTFTLEGTWKAAETKLPLLADLGVTVLEVMPVADFSGKFGWGYDGVNLFAPTRLYGSPDDFRGFVNRAHALGIGIILDVVYNHLGPDGNYLKQFAPSYFTDRYANEWGEAINFDGSDAQPVREFFIANAGYWIDEYHLDGLRLDATQQIFDSSAQNIMTEMGQRVRQAARGRSTIIVAENESQHAKLVRPVSQGGYGLDMLWNDDFHHSAMAVLSAHNEAYYTDYLGAPQEFVSAAKWGFLFQGQRYKWQKHRRGTPALDLKPANFVNFLQNHDQIANSATGKRCHALTSPGRLRAVSALTILMPGTPMLFQGQEFASSSVFSYFADHNPELAPLVRKGRSQFLSQFKSVAVPEMQDRLADPGAASTFERSKLDWSERERNSEVYDLHRDLIAIRRGDLVLRAPCRGSYDGAVLGAEAFVLRYFGGKNGDRLLVVNLGRDLNVDPAPEPLLAPPEGQHWAVHWSSEDPRYGGTGTYHPDGDTNWRLIGHCAVLLISQAGPAEPA
jgi:maltooligosyltrehalose trehalohydrolase